ncbi:MAG: ferritin-like domain-containing protein [Candidatus Sedimenticola sp. (ex Thyasira tokunagai)]
MSKTAKNLFVRVRACLCESDVDEKLRLATELADDWQAGRLLRQPVELEDVVEAGRPKKPELVPPRQLKKRSPKSEEGRLALIHAVTHIEFNAINLACDAAFRFRDMPEAYYADWIRVAAEEAEHFQMLRQRLRDGGRDYGDYPAHNGLWEMALTTAHDLLVRMALVPRMLEARGLDVNPGMSRRFEQVGDLQTVEALKIILRDEVGHVEIGSRWFHYLCEERGLEPEETYFGLLNEYMTGRVSCPLHKTARLQAGFTERELERLEAMCRGGRAREIIST